MAEVIDEVVLPESAARPRADRSSLWARIVGSLKSHGPSLEECEDLVAEVQRFAYELSRRQVRDDEMPRSLIFVSRVNFFVAQVLNGDVDQYLQNTGFSSEFTADLIAAFREIGAVEHGVVMSEISAFVEKGRAESNSIERDKLQALKERLEAEQLSDPKLNARYGRRTGSWDWGGRWSAPIYLCARYVEGWKNLRYVPDDRYEAELDRLAARVPDLAAREQAHREARAWEKKAIEKLMDGDTVYYTAFSPRMWNEKAVWCWNFTVQPGSSDGHRHAIFVDGELIIFRGETDEIIARAPAPECAPGSTTPRNEPEQVPGSLGPNLMLRILDD